jgi:hypothetical protein
MNIEEKSGFAPMKSAGEAVEPTRRAHHGGGARRGEDVPLGRTARSGKFGRMFPHLMPLVPDNAALTELGQAMLDSGGSGDNDSIPAGFTYLGQFLDHDITFDPTALQEVLVDPQALENFRTPMLDLDSVYGAGPAAQPHLYQRGDKDLLLIGSTNSNPGGGDPSIPVSLPNDLPRATHGFAILGDPRNDENLVVAQTHLAFLKFHNKMVEALRDGSVTRVSPLRKGVFEEARDLVIWHYQRMIIDDFLARICDYGVLKEVLASPSFPTCCHEPFIPVEFAAAAYRFGHSMVRERYSHNRVFGFDPGAVTPSTLDLMFRFSGLSGDGTNVPIPSDWIIDWRRFYDFGDGVRVNTSRLIDPLLVPALHSLPGVPPPDSLAVRNLLRGKSLGLPSGQSIARFFGYTPLASADFTGPDGDVAKRHSFDIETPLWYYILKEAEKQQEGKRLGKVGSRIVAEVFLAVMRADASSFYMRKGGWDWEPVLPHEKAGEFHMTDLLRFVGDLNPIG